MHIEQQHQKDENIYFIKKDSAIIDGLFRRYAPKLLAYICHLIPSSLEDAEDVLLEVFIIALEHEQELETMAEHEHRAWLWTVARNKVIDYHRGNRRWRFVSFERIGETIDDALVPEERILQDEEHDQLRACLHTLSIVQQEVLQMRFAGGLSYEEIATVMHKREGAIRTILSRSLKALRSIYRQ
jgi:RNA polymerase sigma factor (sigma-70 family)